MTQIKTAEEMILQKQDEVESNYLTTTNINEIMQDYAKQFIDLAASETICKGTHVDRESILKLKELVK